MISKLLKKIFGDQSERAVRPLWNRLKNEINPISEEIKDISNDELRGRIEKIRSDIRGRAAEYKKQMADLRTEIESLDYDQREPLWKKIDELREEMFDQYARDLDAALPEVFAVVKETGRRFKENDTIEVTATDFDRQLAGQGKDFVTIEGDKAIYKNEWKAGGNLMKWDMMHYDVQLIGGMVLHGIMNNGKVTNNIAEMATGEGKTLVATLPVFLNALTGEGVHVVTVNDYLAKRDSEWMGPLYHVPRSHRGLHRQDRAQHRGAPPGICQRHHIRYEQRVRFRLPPRQHGHTDAGPRAARAALLRHRR